MTDDLIERLGRTLTTMSNDDTSAQGTDLRRRHVERVLAVQDARDRIEDQAARFRELEAAQDDHALMLAYQRGFSDGKAKAEEDAALSALTSAPVTDRGKMVRPIKGQAMCGGYPTGEAPAPVTVQEAARVLLTEWEEGEGLLGELCCYSLDEDGMITPDVDGDWVPFSNVHSALSALAGQGGGA